MKLLISQSLVDMEVEHRPFRHFACPAAISDRQAAAILDWLGNAPWSHRHIEGFYDCYDINLSRAELPGGLAFLKDEATLASLRSLMTQKFRCTFLDRVDIQATKLVPGFSMGVHNDFGPVGQTHRLLFYVNRLWQVSSGGILMMLPDEDPDVEPEQHRYYGPLHASAVGFEITSTSFHAVSQVLAGERFTVAYSFYAELGTKC